MWQCICFSTRLMLAGLGKTKLSRRKRIKVNYFPGGKTEDLQYYLIAYVDKKPDNISSSILVPTVLHNKLKTLYTNNWWMSSTAWKVSKYGVFFLSVFSGIRTEYEEILCDFLYSIRMWENTDQKKLHIWTLFTQGRKP